MNFLLGHVLRLSQSLDFLYLRTYGYYHSNDFDRAEHHAPLFDRQSNKNVNFTVNSWIANGFAADKIVVGIPFYGNSWKFLSNGTRPQNSDGDYGTITDGSMAYYEICHAIQNESWQVFQNFRQETGPYAVSPPNPNGRIWVGYDDPDMAVLKSEYIKSRGLGGIMIWDISMDDFRNKCGQGYNPMLTAIYNTMNISPSLNEFNFKLNISDVMWEGILFRQKIALYFGLFVCICSSVTIFYILFKLSSGTL